MGVQHYEIRCKRNKLFGNKHYTIYHNGKRVFGLALFKTIKEAKDDIDRITSDLYPFYNKTEQPDGFYFTPALLPPPVFTYRIVRINASGESFIQYALEKKLDKDFLPICSSGDCGVLEMNMRQHVRSDRMIENEDGIFIFNKLIQCLYVDSSGEKHIEILDCGRISGILGYNSEDIKSLNNS